MDSCRMAAAQPSRRARQRSSVQRNPGVLRWSPGRLVITIPRAFSVEEAARELGYKDRSSVYDLIRTGDLRAYPLGGGSLRVPADAIIEYLQSVVDAVDGDVPGAASKLSGDRGRPATRPPRRGTRSMRGGSHAA